MQKPRILDAFLLSLFVIVITFQPFFMHGQINLFETGLYLPGIQAILDGQIPYRDFFHLRGPLELYMPAFLMKIFGPQLTVLYSYFYFGNILCLILAVLIAAELYQTRLFLYLMVPVFVARTFPRVVFMFWGGMRYAFGFLALLCVIKFFKKENKIWMFWAGLSTALGLLTSTEIGVYVMMGVAAASLISLVFNIQKRKFLIQSLVYYVGGILLLTFPVGLYLAQHQALGPYLDSVLTVVINMQKVIDPHFVSIYPRNFPEALAAMTNPVHTNFKHMTPSYLYIFILIYVVLRIRQKKISKIDLFIVCLGVYGFIMYNTGFRGLWAAQFEMALQVEKILLFFLFELIFLQLFARREKWKPRIVLCVLIAFILGSIGYSIQRYNHRFFAFKYAVNIFNPEKLKRLDPRQNENSRPLTVERAEGIIVPNDQADELEALDYFIQNNTAKNETIFAYPDWGVYNFLFDRPFAGRFPLATFAWFNDRWQAQFMEDLNSSKPKYVILQKEIPENWKAVYLALEPNQQKFNEVMDFISSNYRVVAETKYSFIYKNK